MFLAKMDDWSTFVFGVLGGSVAALITYMLNRWWDQRRLLAQIDVDFAKQQLSDFYGPIYSYLELATHVYPLWLSRKIDGINEELKARFRQQNEEMVKIITTRAHLIDGPAVPSVLTRFVTWATLWNLYTQKEGALPNEVANLPEAHWPSEFERYIADKTCELKGRLDGLRQRYRLA